MTLLGRPCNDLVETLEIGDWKSPAPKPKIVERDCQADQSQKHAELNWAAREAVWSACDDGDGRQIGGHVRTGPGDSDDGPCAQRQREHKHDRAEPTHGQAGRNAKGTSQLSPRPATIASPHASGGPTMT
jgi:hypothetical protein